MVYVAPLPGGPITVLQGTAAAIWLHADDHSRAEVIRLVSGALEIDEATIEADVNAFIDVLIDNSLLREHSERPRPLR